MPRGGRVKRKQIQSDDGWTVITHGLSNLSVGGHKDWNDANGALARPTGMVEGLTVDKLLENFKRLQERWNETSYSKDVETILGRRTWSVRKAVCIGIGSFSLDWEHRYRSMWQLVLFMAVAKLLQQNNSSTPINLYAQEPIFTSLDTSFLRALDIDVLPTGIETHIAHNTFMFSPFVDWNLALPMFLKGNDPELYVGNQIRDDYGSLAQEDGRQEVLDECNELGRKFLQDREQAELSDFALHMNALNGIVVYWKKDGDGD